MKSIFLSLLLSVPSLIAQPAAAPPSGGPVQECKAFDEESIASIELSVLLEEYRAAYKEYRKFYFSHIVERKEETKNQFASALAQVENLRNEIPGARLRLEDERQKKTAALPPAGQTQKK